MSAQMFTQPDAKHQFTAWMVSHSLPRKDAASHQDHDDAAPMRASETTRTETQAPEKWACDCLSDYYNR
jgi:hypothetical protein